jgi:F-type H+-transporting ATPase subunit b
MRRLPALSLLLLSLSVSTLAFAQEAAEHGEHAGHAEHATEGEHAHGESAKAHGGHHVPSFDDINWYYGLLLEREGAEPSLLFRPKGMPVPFLGYVLNAAILYTLLYRFAKKPVREGLTRRKAAIERGMKEAAEQKAKAEERLAEYEHRLETIEEEVERVRHDMRRAGELERVRILNDARARRERLERDARLLVEQEFAHVREMLKKETVHSALRTAGEALRARVTPSDHAGLAELYLSRLPRVQGLSVAGKGPS